VTKVSNAVTVAATRLAAPPFVSESAAEPPGFEAVKSINGVFSTNPSLWVEKMVGIGYTINMGNKRANLYLAYILILPILVIVLVKTN